MAGGGSSEVGEVFFVVLFLLMSAVILGGAAWVKDEADWERAQRALRSGTVPPTSTPWLRPSEGLVWVSLGQPEGVERASSRRVEGFDDYTFWAPAPRRAPRRAHHPRPTARPGAHRRRTPLSRRLDLLRG